MPHMHKSDKSSHNWGQGLFPKTKFFAGTKNYKKKIAGTKTKTGLFLQGPKAIKKICRD